MSLSKEVFEELKSIKNFVKYYISVRTKKSNISKFLDLLFELNVHM